MNGQQRNTQEEKELKKYGKSSDSGDAELVGTLIVVGGIVASEVAKFLGRAAIEDGKMAIKGSKISSKTV
ncbi:MAG: hypothetical protein O7C59_07555 [Rickettsia endosymbiont of Ixodes persulcatus]|nr:hypothetical protein [Rickettsia endosymbiont of Ixodes persulcatus]MCZ6903474.1 hypothetical protein [Rickettsia endosymbiont of Ixodes persulcatus]MCZ6908854.1 hypothetical protein [Rickettsia endosymbiont of Ixodes persulcatus]MCZ6910550.1 hypothetical protein [Rickettsia endosymbiont of Ixodes persulcatus]MCZ6914302.1 hypothetical protein [Rickettsia endosymbiont of Ixodes persulcatus]